MALPAGHSGSIELGLRVIVLVTVHSPGTMPSSFLGGSRDRASHATRQRQSWGLILQPPHFLLLFLNPGQGEIRNKITLENPKSYKSKGLK